ncbi:MAG: hypothetical protein Q7W13_06270 [Bacteroidia bacterium]|nr:hypothetical protein [Bacteroidia bacterium]
MNSVNKNDIKKSLSLDKSGLQIVLLCATLELIFYFALNNPILSYFGAGLLTLITLFLNINQLIYIFVFLLPNQRLLTLPDSDITLLNIFLIIVFIRCFAFGTILIRKKYFFLVSLIIIYSFLTYGQIGNISNIVAGFKFSLIIIVLLIVFEKNLNDKNWYFHLVIFFTLGCLLTGFLGLLFGDKIVIGDTDRFSGVGGFDADLASLNFSLAFSNFLVLMIINKLYSLKAITIILFLIMFGLLTQSRSFVLVLAFCILFFIITSLKSKNTRKAVVMILFGFLILFVLINLIPDSIIGKLFYGAWERVINPRSGDISNNRFFYWEAYLNILLSNMRYLLWGLGSTANYLILDIKEVAHNGLIEVVLSWGIVGALIIITTFVYAYKFLKSIFIKGVENKLGILGYLPLLVLIITNMTGHAFTSIIFVTQLFISYQAIFETKRIWQNQKFLNSKTECISAFKSV